MDEFDRLMRLPRLCRCCGKPTQGVRCGQCYSLNGRITRMLKQAGKGGMSEKTISETLYLEGVLRGAERDGSLHETPQGWSLGLHPEQVALRTAWVERLRREGRWVMENDSVGVGDPTNGKPHG